MKKSITVLIILLVISFTTCGGGSGDSNEVSTTGITLNKNSTSIFIGSTEQLTATILPDDTENKNVEWSSSNSSIAMVNSSGLITAMAVGSAIITVRTIDGNFTANCSVSIWTNLLGVSGKDTIGYDITVDSSGNSYVVGTTNGNLDDQTLTGTLDNVFVIKYNSSGIKQWTRLLGVSGKITTGSGISVDSSGNSYITGYTNGNLDDQTLTGSLYNIFVIKYNSSGIKQWTRLLGVSGKNTYGQSIAVDSSGNSYIAGFTNGNLGGQSLTGTYDACVIKYNSSGVLQWISLIGVNSEETYALDIAIDSSGNSYATGHTRGNLDGQIVTGLLDGFIIKYNESGVKQWTRLIGVTGKNNPGYGIAVDSSGNSYITGFAEGNLDGQILTGNYDVYVAKYDTSGTKQWTSLYGVIGKVTQGDAIAVDSSGNSYVTGYTNGSLDGHSSIGVTDVYVIKFNTSGVKQWTSSLLGANGKDTFGHGITINSSGKCHVTGQTNGNLDGQVEIGRYDLFITTKLNN